MDLWCGLIIKRFNLELSCSKTGKFSFQRQQGVGRVETMDFNLNTLLSLKILLNFFSRN